MYIGVTIGIVLYLVVLSIIDIRHRKVPTIMLYLFIVAMTVEAVVLGNGIWLLAMLGGVIGALFLVISKLTKEAIGYGDSLLILGLGISLGFWRVFSLLLIAFFLGAIYSIGLLSIRKAKRKTTFPFIPFISISYVIMFVMEVLDK